MEDLWALLFPTTTMLVVMVLATVVGGTMRAFAGFGGGLLLAPVFSLYLPPKDVVVVVVLLNFASTFQLLPGMWKNIDWPLIWRMVPAALIGIPLGALVLSGLDASIFRQLVALVVILVALLLLTGWHYKGPRGRLQDSIAGVTSGMLTSVAGIGGPPFVLYMLSAQGFSPVAFRVFFTVFFAFTQLSAMIMMLIQGALQPLQFAYVGTLLPLYLLATALGAYLFTKALKTRTNQIKRISLWLLLAVGIVTLAL
jgi:uncharacterized membrane protein YfcA